jgi:hypothetical protein
MPRPSHVLLTAAVVAIAGTAPLAGQSASMPPWFPAAGDGLSTFGVHLSRLPRFTLGDRGWVPSLHADIAIANSPTRVALSAARFSKVDGAGSSSIGAGLGISRVFVERDFPNRMVWGTLAAGAADLAPEGREDASVFDLSLTLAGAQILNPPGVGELMLAVAPRVQYRRLSGVPGMDRSAGGGGATITLDWASQSGLGAVAAMEVEWLSERPAGDKAVQVAFGLGATYRMLLFRRRARLPPPEEP